MSKTRLQTDILVIGGGATGTGVLRDLAMRGFKAILVEKGDLAHGTTGRYHGLLHSGGRYVVRDPQAAGECIQENRILRRIMPHCIEDTGGFFVLTPWDDPEYASQFVAGCQKASIPVEEVPISQMLLEEPLLNPAITRCFRVPDGSADSFLAADCNVESAKHYGASCLNYHKTLTLLRQGNRVVGARCLDKVNGEEVEIYADMVVNASGAWAGQVAATVGIDVHVIPGKGTMLATNHRIVNTVINRCKMPSDGDILVPTHTVSVIGTTDVKVNDPDHFAIEPWEVHLMLTEGDKLVPGFKEMRMLRAWAGVRPLYQDSEVNDTRQVTRAFVLLDHEVQDGLAGLVTITSGKWTTSRKMAESTVDLVCQKLNTQRPCRTHLEALPDAKGVAAKRSHHYLGERLAKIEKNHSYGQLVCECELATYEDVAQAITRGQAKAIDDIRRDVRLGMGPCQGGFCTYRAAGILQKLRHPPIEDTNVALRDFLQERWKGLLPILWGQQLRQERLDELIYLSVLNADHLPGKKTSPISPELYEPSSQSNLPPKKPSIGPISGKAMEHSPALSGQSDVLVVGAGLSGLSAAWQAAARGKRTRLIAKGHGALYWNAGCIDVLGYHPIDSATPLESPIEGIASLISANPGHPYALAGLEAIADALSAFQELSAAAGYPMPGSLERNWLLPSALGTFRPTCLAPETMVNGDLHRVDPMLIIGFEGFQDFYPELMAANLSIQGIRAAGATLDIPELQNHRIITGRILAELFETPEFIVQLAKAVKDELGKVSHSCIARVGFPAVFGLNSPLHAKRSLEDEIGLPVFEIPTLPPSIPGIRLSRLLINAIQSSGGRFFEGMQAMAAEKDPQGQLSSIWSEASARRKSHRAANFILATGGILGGGFSAAYEGNVSEVICGLPISAPADRNQWINRQFLGSEAHPIFRSGIQVDANFQPIDPANKVIHNNLYAVGTGLANADFLRERSFDGVALVTGYLVGKTF